MDEQKISDQPGRDTSDDSLRQQPSLTFGQKLVGLNFNPSNDDKVGKAKQLCADLADLLKDDWKDNEEKTQMYGQLHVHAMNEILNAQMNVVKVLTLKY